MPFPSMFGSSSSSSSSYKPKKAHFADDARDRNPPLSSTSSRAAAGNAAAPTSDAQQPRSSSKPSSFTGGAIEVSFEEDEVTVGDDEQEEQEQEQEQEQDNDNEDEYDTEGDDRGSSVEEEEEDEDDDEFEEYTVYDEETVAAAATTVHTKEPNNAKVKMYNEGATPLFLLIEESNWHKALSYINRDACETWVQSTGTMATTFQWSLWRRLPLHEACRRQAPAWFISQLVRAYPGAASQPTQFGELPLHLAVECGAPPEVVNLLLVAHWPGIAAKDQSGRTPLEILKDVELLNAEDARVVLESLERSHDTWMDVQQQMAYEKQDLEAAHRSALKQVVAQHEADMAEEFQQHADLIEQVQHLTVLLERLQDTTVTQQDRIDSLTGVETSWRERVDSLERSLEVSRAETSAKKDEVATLARMLVQKNRHVETLEAECAQLKADLHAASGLQQDLASKVAVTERDLHQLVTSYCTVQDTLARHFQDLRGVVHQRGAHHVDPSHSSLWQEPAPSPSSTAAPDAPSSSSQQQQPAPSSPRRSTPTQQHSMSTPPRKPSSSNGSINNNSGSPHQSKYRKSPVTSHHSGGMKEDEKKQDDSSSSSSGRSGGMGRTDKSSNHHDNAYVESGDEAMARAAAAASTALSSNAK
jgi:hypothetical protein